MINKNFLEKWISVAQILGAEAPKDPPIKILNHPLDEYSFGVILNERRLQKPMDYQNELCRLCLEAKATKKDPRLNLLNETNLNETNLNDLLLVINKFPIFEGFSLAIPKIERPFYSTLDLSNFEKEISGLLEYSKKFGLELYHNHPGLGASIPNHEHWHLTNFKKSFEISEVSYGFESAEKISTKKDSSVMTMPKFPFANLIFNHSDVDKISSFLSKLGKEYGNNYLENKVPHTISEGECGLLISVGKGYFERGWSSSEFSGHIIVGNSNDFSQIDYQTCINRLGTYFLKNDEINLERFL